MYSKQLIAAGGGLFAFGALVGWALTADRWALKNKELKALVESQHEALNRHVYALSDHIVEGPYDTEEDLIAHRDLLEDLRPEQIHLSEISLVAEEPNPIYGVHPVSLITDDEGEPISYISEDSDVGTTEDSDSENSPEGTPDESSEDDDRYVEGEPEIETETRLRKAIAKYAANPDDVDTFVALGRRASKNAHETPPYVISMAEYAAGEVGDEEYAKITHMYFPRDRVMLDDEEEVIDAGDVDAMVGWRNMNSFGGESGDPNVVFIRNDRLRTDFEVVKDDENDPPIHVRFGMSKNMYEANVKAGAFRFRDEDSD